MNADKRRRTRVQGGWAATGPSQRGSNKHVSIAPTSVVAPSSCPESEVAVNEKSLPGARQGLVRTGHEGHKPSVPTLPAWAEQNVVTPKINGQNFTFEEPQEEIKMKPADLVITKPGVYDISTEPSGISRLRYFPQFLEPSRSEKIFAELLDEIHWEQQSEVHNGIQAIQPRLTAWYSDLPYTYAGITVEANTLEWPKALKDLKDQLADVTEVQFNSLAANLYRDGHDSIGWHSDDEPIMGKNPTIASISFGEERVFELRKKPPPGESGERDYTYSQVVKVPLRTGSLLIMEGWTQSDWQHRVPKEYHDRGARINITFRVAKPFGVR